ncbi:helix-turn-helix domain-containing protein [Serratia microhaemolytica]|uniref:helix-turn-helix domain-containing protein n=1 Tax=Serratia microhaemolytica TaxID=2675110 RepID=UPI000FDD9AD6|nr:helix-turn-helix domain-containing protein [Serratia microhaemolytica]
MTPEKTADVRVLDEINRLLQEKRLTKAWLAKQSGMSYEKIKRLLNGQQVLPMREAEELLVTLGSSFDALFSKPFRENIQRELDRYE